MSSSPKFSVVLLGATGYTGKLCAEYTTRHLPTNLEWAVAGRSTNKLQDLVDELEKINPDRRRPEVVCVSLEKNDLDGLAKSTRVLLNCVGPYHQYSTPVVAACAENGTHYLDVTGETPWIRELVQKYHDTATANRAIIIPEIGLESAPSDLVTYKIASTIRKSLNRGVRDVVCSVHEFKGATASGGSLATALGLLDHYTLAEIRAATKPYVLSPATQPTKPPTSRSLLSRLLGPFKHPTFGILTTAITATPNRAIVYRSAGLMPDLYGKNFQYEEYLRVPNYAVGMLIHFALVLLSLVLAIRPLRSVIRRFVYQPGQGPDAQGSADAALELRAVGVADDDGDGDEIAAAGGAGTAPKKATARLRYEGGSIILRACCWPRQRWCCWRMRTWSAGWEVGC